MAVEKDEIRLPERLERRAECLLKRAADDFRLMVQIQNTEIGSGYMRHRIAAFQRYQSRVPGAGGQVHRPNADRGTEFEYTPGVQPLRGAEKHTPLAGRAGCLSCQIPN